jgi:hypothetical protein
MTSAHYSVYYCSIQLKQLKGSHIGAAVTASIRNTMSFQTPTKKQRSGLGSTEDDKDSAVQDLSGVVQRLNHRHARSRYYAVFLRNVLTPEECQSLVARSESEGYEPALLNVGAARQIYATDIRSNDRCLLNDPGWANVIFHRIQEALADHPDLIDPFMN